MLTLYGETFEVLQNKVELVSSAHNELDYTHATAEA